uniref:Uncharacterized protein n=1 Tax=Brassica oleracea TaxID=3712 RepID=A0A3P6FJ85_BRAOL|nr:unnamed protein product [Brassica oleracea]
MIEANSMPVKEKVKLEFKSLRMLNNGTKQLDYLLSIGKGDRCSLGFQGNLIKLKVFSYQQEKLRL